uniref:ADF-H domain-containing protein n=1 Tax=Mucochytrium quahogii TaxID=96639 RepID=A0A7S2WBX4_9STRA|mmetsp:Transcript_19774/g.32493  ORF Transcript_19774/g.32493 Transcript_19774/m.32493 type:complete len:164 (+) Transcript_19774:145-636(+)
MGLTFPENTDELVNQLFDDNNKGVDFVIFTMEGKETLVVQDGHVGKGGRDKVEEILKENKDKIMTGCFLVLGVDDREVTVSIRRKYIQFIYVGEEVSGMAKARVVSQSGELKNVFPSAHMNLQINEGDFSDLSEKDLERQLRACGGAHQPTSYDFSCTAADEA